MNDRQALYIQTIAREGSITAAAQKLYVSQPALSQTVHQVEVELGVSLFDRSTLPLRLTYAGEKYLECVQAITIATEQLKAQIQDIQNENSGRLRLGISVQRSMQMLPYVLPLFRKKFPNVTIELHEAGSAHLEEMLRTREIDLALAAMESTGAHFDCRLIEEEVIGIIASKETRLAREHEAYTPLALEETRDEDFVCLKEGHSVRVVQNYLFRKHGMEPNIILETDSLEVAKRVTVSSGACMLCSDIYLDEITRTFGVFFPVRDYENHRHFYACWRKGERLPRYAEGFVEIITQVLDKNTGLTHRDMMAKMNVV